MNAGFRIGVASVLALAAARVAVGGFPATDVFLPSVGRGPGKASSQWYTAMWVHNPTASPANVQVFFLRRDQPNLYPLVFNITVPPGDTTRIEDAITTLFGVSGFGALRVVSDQKLLVSSRIYSQPPGGSPKDTVGQFFAAVPASFAIAAGQSTTLLGVYQTSPQASSQFRYNFGFVETTGQPAGVRVTAYDETGALVGSKDYPIGGFEPRQYDVTDLLPAVNSQNLRLTVEVLSGSGKVVAFGSGLANASNDPSTFEMSFRDDLLGGGTGAVVTDATLTGDGTSAAPLGVANGAITKPRIAASGGTAGQYLAFDGTNLVWQSAGLSLPYTGHASADVNALQVYNDGTGLAIAGTHSTTGNYGELGKQDFGVHGVAFSGVGVYGQSRNSDGLVGESAAATKSGVYGVNNSTGGGYGLFGANALTSTSGYVGGTYGVYGSGGANRGVMGDSASAAGVWGKSTSGPGTGGESTSGFGVHGKSQSGDGVAGETSSASKSGVWGQSTVGVGVTGTSSAKDGIVGVTSSTAAGAAGVRARNTGGSIALYSEGDIYATGAFRGDIGPGGGAPFPRPAYDSGWFSLARGQTVTLTHNLGGDPDTYVIDLMNRSRGFGSIGMTDMGVGFDSSDNGQMGFMYSRVTSTSLDVKRGNDDSQAEFMEYRVRIWVYR